MCKKLNDQTKNGHSKAIVYGGGNNVASDNFNLNELRRKIDSIQADRIHVSLGTVASAADCKITVLYRHIRQISQELDCSLTDVYLGFVFDNGAVATHLFHHDGIHQNLYGTRTLLSTINSIINITKG